MKPPSLNGIRSRYEKQFIGKPDRIGNYLIHQIGEQDCEPGYRCDPHVQWCYEISYVISGEGMTSIDGKEYEVHEGDLFITPVGVQHEVFSNHHFRYMFIGFSICNGALNDDTRLIDSFYQASPVNIMKGDHEIMLLFSRCLNEYYNASLCHSLMIECCLNELAVSVMRIYLSQSRKNYRNEIADGSGGISMYAVMLYIDSSIRTIQSIGEIVQKFNYSASYLSHCFKQQMGITLQQYICRKKIEESIRMMEESGQTITDVAYQIGFANPQAYTRAFKRVVGVPPKEYFSQKKLVHP